MPEADDIVSCPHCGTSVDVSALGFLAEPECPQCGQRMRVHTHLLNFRLERVLGIGGMSVVYAAHDPELNRVLAIKVLNDIYRRDPIRVARFEKECALMARVRHDNVVSVYSAGHIRGQFYIAMEMVNGRNAEQLVTDAGKPLPPLYALDIVQQVVDGLDAAHRAGILHRDMKPGNILITDDGRAKVLDFGLSLGCADADTEEIIWATPYCTSPEALTRAPEDARSDIYALGMTLRFLLTGCGNFDPVPTDIDGMLACKRNLPPPDAEALHIDESYAELITRMTAYEAAERPADYAELTAAIKDVRNAQMLYEARHTPEALLRRLVREIGMASAVAACGAAAAFLGWYAAAPEPVYHALPVEETLPGTEETEALAAAEALLTARSWTAAADAFRAIAEETQAAPLGAWCGIVASFIYDCAEEPRSAHTARETARRHADTAHQLSSAGSITLRSVRAALSTPDEMPDAASPLLRGILVMEQHKNDLVAGKMQDARVHRVEVVRLLRSAAASYRPLAELVEQSATAREKRVEDAHASRTPFVLPSKPTQIPPEVPAALARHDFAAALSALSVLEKNGNLPPDEAEKLRAFRELAEIGRMMTEMLRDKFGSAYRAGMPPTAMAELVSGIPDPTLKAEVLTLGYLLSGQYDAAKSSNPYADNPYAAEPFAVLMRHWLPVLREAEATELE